MGKKNKYGINKYNDYPSSLSCTPVLWNYIDKPINLNFRAGLIRITYSQKSGIKPVMGYSITEF